MEVLALDVSCYEDMSNVLLKDCRKSVTGIVHAAGVLKDRSLERLDWPAFLEVLHPKVHGSCNLHTISTRSAWELSSFTMLSTSSAILGSMGQCNYLAANSFLDALALFRQQQGLCGQSIAWTAWEIGMAKDLRLPRGMFAVSTKQGAEALLMRYPLPYVMQAQVDWRAYVKGGGNAAPLQDILEHSPGTRGSHWQLTEREGISLPEKLQHILQNCLPHTALDKEAGFYELGLDSLALGEFAVAVTKEIGLAVSNVDLFDFPSIMQLAGYLRDRLTSQEASQTASLAIQGPGVGSRREPGISSEILGVACRYPGDVNSFLEMCRALAAGKDCVGKIPADRWETVEGIYTDRIGHVGRLDLFDAAFFNIPPATAKLMDPQLRMTLETTYHGLEDARIAGDRDDAMFPTAVIAGYMTADFLQDYGRGEDTSIPTGTIQGLFPNHVSHFFDFKGPSLSCQSACSSSLVALDWGRRHTECGGRAIALGANVIMSRELMLQACRMNMLSKKGRCCSFGTGADGYVRSEGCGVVILGRCATEPKDPMHGVLAGSAVGHDGRSSGLTVPNPIAQQHVIELALRESRASGCISYLEAHGTGTDLGDPLEIKALRTVFAASSPPLLLGTGKTTFGHLEATAGILGVHRALCCLRGHIPKHIWLRELNPRVEEQLGETGQSWCHIVAEEVPWTGAVAGVSSFGLGGTNAHALVERATEPEPKGSPKVLSPQVILVLSAKSQRSLDGLKADYGRFLQESGAAWEDCLGAAVGKPHYLHRFAAVGSPSEVLQALASPSKPAKILETEQLRVSVELSGGLGDSTRGHDLLERNPAFRDLFDFFAEHIAGLSKPLALAMLLQTWGLPVQLAGNLPAELLSELQKIAETPMPASSQGGWDFTGLKSRVSECSDTARSAKIQVQSLCLHGDVVPLPTEWIPTLLGVVADLYVKYRPTLEWALFRDSFGVNGYSNPSLPLYSFDRRRHWPQPGMTPEFVLSDHSGTLWFKLQLSGLLCFFLDHCVGNREPQAVLPAAAHVQVLLDVVHLSMKRLGESFSFFLKDLHLLKALPVTNTSQVLLISSQVYAHGLELKVTEENEPSSILCKARAHREKGPARRVAPCELAADKISDREEIYARLAAIGLHYGESFQVLKEAVTMQGAVDCVRAEMSGGWPVGMWDGALQALALSQQLLERVESPMPVRIQELHAMRPIVEAKSAVASWNPPMVECFDSLGQLVAVIQGVQVSGAKDVAQPNFESMFFHEEWSAKNSTLLGLTKGERCSICEVAQGADMMCADLELEADINEKLNSLARAYAVLLLGSLSLKHPELAKKLHGDLQRASIELGDPLARAFCEHQERDPEAEVERRASLVPHCAELALLRKCGERLRREPVPEDASSVLALLSPEIDQLYSDGISSKAANDYVGQCISRMLDIAPSRTSILEIGAGTGATTRAILGGAASFPRSNYVFTDMSKSYLDLASPLNVSRRILDIERDPAGQGFAPHSFDIVVCTNVLHTTQDLGAALQNVRRLCAFGGLLVLSETVENETWLDLTFGLLPGWWRFADREKTLLTCAEWKQALCKEGFELMRCSQGRQVVMLARSAHSMPPRLLAPSERFWIVKRRKSQAEEFERACMELLSSIGEAGEVVSIEDIEARRLLRACVFLVFGDIH